MGDLRDQLSKLVAEEERVFLSDAERAEYDGLTRRYSAAALGALDSQRDHDALDAAAKRGIARLYELSLKEARLRQMAAARAGGGEGLPTQTEYETARARDGRMTDTERMLAQQERDAKALLGLDPRKRGT
jgi:hypothetical protein